MLSLFQIQQPSIVLPFCICNLMTWLLILGAIVLLASLYFVRKLIKELPTGINRNSWWLLGILILLFIFGYLGFYLMKRNSHYSKPEMLVPLIFFFGAVFVLLVCLLAYRTTKELKRVVILEHETLTDPLLGISNRRCLDRRLHDEVLRSQRHQLFFSLLMVDIDHFKKVNDTWGHQIGDLVLQHLVETLGGTLRQTDLIARFGGEEFVIMLPHTPEPESYKLAERLRRNVEKTPLIVTVEGRPQELRITISIGSACLKDHDTVFDLLERADKAMYRAKQDGRNRVVRCEGHDPGDVQ